MIVSRDTKFVKSFNSEGSYKEFYNNGEKPEQPAEENPIVYAELLNESSDMSSENNVGGQYQNENGNVQIPAKRRSGRPRKVKTGQRGRPRKVYHTEADDVTVPEEERESSSEEEQTTVQEELNPAESEAAYLINVTDPETVEQAFSNENASEWIDSIEKEYIAHIECGTWDIVDLPKNAKEIGNRIVFQTKINENGDTVRRKARLVAKGYTQRPGIDFRETYAPVARASSIRLLMALAAERGLIVHQMDVVTAYLNGKIEEKIYMEVPDKLEEVLNRIIQKGKTSEEVLKTAKKWLKEVKSGKTKTCKVKRALYGLKQSGRQWYCTLDSELKALGMKPLDADKCVYTMEEETGTAFVAVYVDDLIILSDSMEKMQSIKSKLIGKFKIKDIGPIHYCLGIKFEQNSDKSVVMSQCNYVQSVLERFGMENCKPIGTPMDANGKLKAPDISSEEKVDYPYQNLIGSLMYLATSTRPDIAYVVSALSQYNTNYGNVHWVAAKRVLRYLKGTMDYGLKFTKTGEDLTGFVDADWGSCLDDRKSHTGYLFKYGGGAISWESRKQRTVALSSAESEYMALTEGAKEAIHLRNFLEEVGIKNNTVVLHNDSQSAQLLSRNDGYHSRTKHIDIRHHFIREVLKKELVVLEYMPTERMPADVLTKGLFKPKHQRCIDEIGIVKC